MFSPYISAASAAPIAQESTARNTEAVPAELRSMVRQAANIATMHDYETMKRYGTKEASDSLKWVLSKTTRAWTGGILTIPASALPKQQPRAQFTPYIAVFHAWHTCQSDGDHIHSILKSQDGWLLGPEVAEREAGGYRIIDHDLTVNVDFSTQKVSIHDNARLEMRGIFVHPCCLFRISEDFAISLLKVGGKPVPFQQVGGVVLFQTPSPDKPGSDKPRSDKPGSDKPGSDKPGSDKPGEQGENREKTDSGDDIRRLTLEMSYAGTVKHSGSDYVLTQEATLNSYWYPTIARLPSTATVTVTAPAGMTAIAQGERVKATKNPDGTSTVTYRNDIPTCWFTVDIGRYFMTRRTMANGPVLSIYLLSDNAKMAQRCLDILESTMMVYSKNFAPFPYTHYDVIETKGPFGGALEGYSMATFGPGTLPGTIVHELAHTWWGGIVPCSYTRSMWNESFADYSSALFARMARNGSEKSGDQPGLTGPGPRSSYRGQFDAWTMLEAFDTSDGPQGAVGYGKGSLVMRVLEEELGQPTMFRCLQEYIKAHKRGEVAEWDEFASVVNRVSGKDYGWFFSQWLGRKGLPVLRLANLEVQRQGNRYLVTGDIVQQGEPYRMRLPIRVVQMDRKSVSALVEVEGASTHFSIETGVAPMKLLLDPNSTIPLAIAPEDADVILK